MTPEKRSLLFTNWDLIPVLHIWKIKFTRKLQIWRAKAIPSLLGGSLGGLVGHEQADQSAKDKAQRGEKPVEQWSSLTHIERKLIESHSQELTRWHEVKIQEKETSRRGFYNPRVEKGMSKVLGHTAKKYPLRYLQHKVGHAAVEKDLAKIGVIETPQCGGVV